MHPCSKTALAGLGADLVEGGVGDPGKRREGAGETDALTACQPTKQGGD